MSTSTTRSRNPAHHHPHIMCLNDCDLYVYVKEKVLDKNARCCCWGLFRAKPWINTLEKRFACCMKIFSRAQSARSHWQRLEESITLCSIGYIVGRGRQASLVLEYVYGVLWMITYAWRCVDDEDKQTYARRKQKRDRAKARELFIHIKENDRRGVYEYNDEQLLYKD